MPIYLGSNVRQDAFVIFVEPKQLDHGDVGSRAFDVEALEDTLGRNVNV